MASARTLILLLVSLPTLALGDPPSAPPLPFAGRWLLDAERSDPPDALLQALGRGAFEQSAARRIRPEHHLGGTMQRVELRIQTPLRTSEEVLVPDGTPRRTAGAFGGDAETTCQWAALVLRCDSTQSDADGRPVLIRSERELIDPQTMRVRYELPATTPPRTVVRIFTRAE